MLKFIVLKGSSCTTVTYLYKVFFSEKLKIITKQKHRTFFVARIKKRNKEEIIRKWWS